MKYLALISMVLGLAAIGSLRAEGESDATNVGNFPYSGDMLTHGKITGLAREVSENDEVRFRLVGVLENSCRKVGSTSVYFDSETHTFAIDQRIRTMGEVCLQRMMPFSVEVNLGRLPEGNYSVQVGQGNGQSREFKVSPNTTGLL
jgi:hypothetical protein